MTVASRSRGSLGSALLGAVLLAASIGAHEPASEARKAATNNTSPTRSKAASKGASRKGGAQQAAGQKATAGAAAAGAGAAAAASAAGPPAGPRILLICDPGGPGTPEDARAYVDGFSRELEKRLGWKAGTFSGGYETTETGCTEFIARSRPAYGVFALPAFLRHQGPDSLQVMGRVVVGKVEQNRYHLMVAKGGPATLEALRGKILVSNHLSDPVFLSRVVFSGKLDAATHFRLQPTGLPLKGIRAVSRGQAEATLIDEGQLQALATMELEKPLVSIFDSPPLPPMTLAAFSRLAPAGEVAAVGKALLTVCDSAEGKPICASMRLTRILRSTDDDYRDLLRRYRGR